MPKVIEMGNSIVFENKYVQITVSKGNSLVEEIIDKQSGKDIKGEDICFFKLITKENESIEVTSVSLKGDVITVTTVNGSFDVKTLAFDEYFTFEIASHLPKGTFYAEIAHAKYSYDFNDKKNTGACGVAMSIWANPMFFPDCKSLETLARVYPHLGDVGAKYGLVIAPIVNQRDILKTVCLTIDKNVGLVSSTGGAWGRDSRLNFSNYSIQYDTSREFIDETVPYFKKVGVDQIDLHQGLNTFRQGDFKFAKYKDAAEFKKNVSDVLEANGMAAGLHSYSCYIDFGCDTIMSKPENQKQIRVLTHLTLAEDITSETTFIKINEDTSIIPKNRSASVNNSSHILIGEELIKFNIADDGLEVVTRGDLGTKAAAHKKGSAVDHLEGHYGGFAPIFGSDLFYQIARNTAKAYNEGGFKMIYLDALDGMYYHCNDRKNEPWLYIAAFICEVLKHCDTDPILEGAAFVPSMWAARGRIGALDCPYKGFKNWNMMHTARNVDFIDSYNAPTMGWYNYYPQAADYPGNENTKYQFFDDIDFLGTLAVIYDFSTVFHNGGVKDTYLKYAAMRRNLDLYKKYDDLRKAQYFSEEYREKLKNGKWEYKLVEKRGGRYSFVEKDYQKYKLYDLNDTNRNYAEMKNPFGKQTPFVRIEAMMSTLKENPMVLLPLDENKPLAEQKAFCEYGGDVNLSNHLAKVVKVFGNGKGGRIRIRIEQNTTRFCDFYIDLDFKGWREFILLETDNGEYKAEPFEEGTHFYHTYRHGLNHSMINAVRIDMRGDTEDVRMSSLVAYEHTYEILKNPTVSIGDTSVTFECEMKSTDYIEFDGKEARVYDRYGNSMPVWFNSQGFVAPRGKFKATLTAKALNRGTPRARLTLGFTGKEVK